MPGFKNAHTHSAMTFLRSHADDLPLLEWLNRQVMQALLLCLGAMAVSLLVHKLSAVFAIVPLFGWMLRWGVDQVVDLLLLLGMALFAIRAADRMHKGLDSDIPFAASFVNRLF